MLKRNGFIREDGFTLIELILVIVLFGVVSIIGIARFLDTTQYKKNLFQEDIHSTLHLAKKMAMTSGCDIKVSITQQALELNRRNNCNVGDFTEPVYDSSKNKLGYIRKAPSGLLLNENYFYFNSIGQVIVGGIVVNTQIKINNIKAISIKGETGYVSKG